MNTIDIPENTKQVVITCEMNPNGRVSTKQYKEYLAKLREKSKSDYKEPLQHNKNKIPKQKCKKYTKSRMRDKAEMDIMVHKIRVQKRKELEAEQSLVTAPSLLV